MRYISKVMVGIVTYNPDIKLLQDVLDKLLEEKLAIVIVDNNSNCVSGLNSLLIEEKYSSIKFMQNRNNEGVAYAENQIFAYAENYNYEFVLTLDQDSIIPDGYVNYAYDILSANAEIGIVTPAIYERQLQKEIISSSSQISEVNKCISSGSIIRISAWRDVNGFIDCLFIDYVDFFFCKDLRRKGYKIVRTELYKLSHTLGDSVSRKMLFWKVRVTNHNSFRKYYICRNIILYIRKYFEARVVLAEGLRLCKVFLFILLYENNKKEKIRTCFNGIRDGFFFDMSLLNESRL